MALSYVTLYMENGQHVRKCYSSMKENHSTESREKREKKIAVKWLGETCNFFIQQDLKEKEYAHTQKGKL